WLYRIAHNHAITVLRRDSWDYDELNEALPGADAPESVLERRTLIIETLTAVAALPELQREAIVRTAIDGSSYEEVAAALGVSDNAVRGLVYRARTSLRAALTAVAPNLWSCGLRGPPGETVRWLSGSVHCARVAGREQKPPP
ncbi:MAG: sigma-70 family RNA polymerase sigma factor, partial [Solirubrobacterales bacterium]|nr:sigma-70 family RNA polymerase sigma factor [Solirubrobacterales bacterium]